MNVWQKKTTRYRLNGRIVSRATLGAERETIESKRFYGTVNCPDGKRKQIPLSEDRKASATLLRRLQTEADRQRAVGVDRYAGERKRPLAESLSEYETHLRSKENTERYVTQTMGRLRRLLSATKTKTVGDLDAGRIASTLAEWRRRKRKPVSVETSNHYARSAKSFSRWLRRLIIATAESGVTIRGETWTFSPVDRATLYALAAFTGLRASELASLPIGVRVQRTQRRQRIVRRSPLRPDKTLSEYVLRRARRPQSRTLTTTQYCDRRKRNIASADERNIAFPHPQSFRPETRFGAVDAGSRSDPDPARKRHAEDRLKILRRKFDGFCDRRYI